MQTAREFNGYLIAAFFFDGEVTLQFDVNIFAAENSAQLLQTFPCAFSSVSAKRMSKRAFVSSCQANQSAVRAFQFFCCNGAFAFAARSFIRVIRRQRFLYPSGEVTSSG